MAIEKNKPANRKYYMDALRIVCILFVIFNHTGKNGYVLFIDRQQSPFYWIYLLVSLFIKTAVPIFYMISGALLIPKEESLATLYKKRILRHFLILIVFSILSYLYSLGFDFRAFSLKDFFTTLYTNRHATAYWYLYSYLGYLMVLPFIRKLANNLDNKMHIYMLVLFVFNQSLTVLDWLFFKGDKSRNSWFVLFVAERTLFYPLMGYFLDSKLPKNKYKYTCVLLVCFSIVTLLISAILTTERANYLNAWTESEIQKFAWTYVCFPSMALFLFFKIIFEKTQRSYRLLYEVSSCTFGIMLIENICRKETFSLFTVFNRFLPKYLACWSWVLVSFLLALLIVSIAKHIPLLKRLL